jgi:hypothetical protein
MDIWEIRADQLEESQRKRRAAYGDGPDFWNAFETGQLRTIRKYRQESKTYGQTKRKQNRDGSIQEGLF